MLRNATYEDCQEIYRMVCLLEGAVLPRESFEATFLRQLHSEDHLCLLYQIQGQATGFLNLHFQDTLHHPQTIAELTELYIDPQFRRKGIGRTMFSAVCQIARDKGCMQLELSCNQVRTQAHQFYRSQGMDGSHTKFTLPL